MTLLLQAFNYSNSTPILGSMFGLIFFLAAVGVFVAYLITLQNTLKEISPANREMEPGMVWLMFIPLFNWVWHFIIVERLSNSIRKELAQADQAPAERPAYTIGIVSSALFCGTWIPVLGAIISLAAMVCGIIYWVKIAEFKRRLQSLPRHFDNDSQIFGSKDSMM